MINRFVKTLTERSNHINRRIVDANLIAKKVRAASVALSEKEVAYFEIAGMQVR